MANPYGKAPKGETAAQKKTRQAKYYTEQRKEDESKAAKGDKGALTEAEKIYRKKYGGSAKTIGTYNKKTSDLSEKYASAINAHGKARGEAADMAENMAETGASMFGGGVAGKAVKGAIGGISKLGNLAKWGKGAERAGKAAEDTTNAVSSASGAAPKARTATQTAQKAADEKTGAKVLASQPKKPTKDLTKMSTKDIVNQHGAKGLKQAGGQARAKAGQTPASESSTHITHGTTIADSAKISPKGNAARDRGDGASPKSKKDVVASAKKPSTEPTPPAAFQSDEEKAQGAASAVNKAAGKGTTTAKVNGKSATVKAKAPKSAASAAPSSGQSYDDWKNSFTSAKGKDAAGNKNKSAAWAAGSKEHQAQYHAERKAASSQPATDAAPKKAKGTGYVKSQIAANKAKKAAAAGSGAGKTTDKMSPEEVEEYKKTAPKDFKGRPIANSGPDTSATP